MKVKIRYIAGRLFYCIDFETTFNMQNNELISELELKRENILQFINTQTNHSTEYLYQSLFQIEDEIDKLKSA